MTPTRKETQWHASASSPRPRALAGALAAAAPAQAQPLSFTAIEFKNTGLVAFMDYTDDDCMAIARGGQEGEE